MKPGKGGNATGPPRLGRAIIGATLLLKSDVFAPGVTQKQNDPEKPGTARGDRTRIELPETGFGEAKGVKVAGGKSLGPAPVKAAGTAPVANEERAARPRVAQNETRQVRGSDQPVLPAPTGKPSPVAPKQFRTEARAARAPLFDLPPERESPEPAPLPPAITEARPPPASTTFNAPTREAPAQVASEPLQVEAGETPPPQIAALPEPAFGGKATEAGAREVGEAENALAAAPPRPVLEVVSEPAPPPVAEPVTVVATPVEARSAPTEAEAQTSSAAAQTPPQPLETAGEAPQQPSSALPEPAFGGRPETPAAPGASEPAREGSASTSAAAPSRPVLSVVTEPVPPPSAETVAAAAEPAQGQSVKSAEMLAEQQSLTAPATPPETVDASALPQPGFAAPASPAPAPQPRALLSDRELAAVSAPAVPGPEEPGGPTPASVGTAGTLAGQPGTSGGPATPALPEPAFGGSDARSSSPSSAQAEPLPEARPTRLAVADLPAGLPGDGGLPRPDFGPSPAPVGVPGPASQPPAELAASRTAAAVPLSHNLPDPAATAALPAVQPRAGLADTSPRMPGDPAPVFTLDDELILQLQTPRGELADTITAYGTRSAVYLPLGAITRFLDLAISVSDEGHYASGWFLDEKQTMSINLRQGTLTVNGKELSLFRSDAAAFEGELYLRADRFSEIFPLTLTVDLRAQTVTVKTLVPFPFEQRMERDEVRARLSGGTREAKRWPREDTPYQALSFPMADAELRGVSDSTFGTRAEGDLRIAGDFAFMTARAFASASSRDGLTGARIELGRRDPDGGLLGPLDATEFQLGDVTTTALPLGLRGVSGRGAFITNTPLERASVFDTIDLRGELPEGYEVELYRNNVLIGSTRSPVNGQYQFLKTSVDYGLNIFRLVFFGPQGQRREEVRRLSVGDGRLNQGEFVYTLGAAQKDVNVFNVYGPNFSPTLDFRAWRGNALLEYGLSKQITASLGGAWYESRFGKRWLATAGLRTGIGGTALRLDLGYESHGAKAALLGLGGKLGGATYALTHAEYSGGFTDEVQTFTADPLRRATELNVNTAIKLGGGDQPLTLPLYGQYRRVEFADGRTQSDATLRGSLPLGGLMLSNTLSYDSNSGLGFGSTSQLQGTFDLASLSGSRLQLRAGLDYGVLPKLRLEGGMVEANYALDDRTLVRATVGHTLIDGHTQFGLSAVRRFGKFNLAFDGAYGIPDRSYSAALRLGFSFGRNPLNGKVFFAEPGMAAGGAIAARAFRDSNGNRRFDTGEGVLPDVEFIAGSRSGKTDAQGVVFLGGMGDGNRASMTAFRESLPDISLAPVTEGIEIVPRAGRVHVTDFAVQELSDIEGTALFSEGGSLGREVSGLRLQLVDEKGKEVARARTEGDGSYFFEQVPPGAYAIQIDRNQAASLKIHLAEPIAVTVGSESAYLKQVVKVSADTTPVETPPAVP